MKKAALISVYREHIDNILSGKKIFEYRRAAPRHEISQLALYCSAPVQKIVAVADVLQRIAGAPTRIWDDTSVGAGISRRIFRDYYAGCSKASVFILGNVYKMETPMELSELSCSPAPPQSFRYLDNADMNQISERKSMDSVTPRSLLFMGGVHGVGKSSLACDISRLTGYQCFNAGDLIDARRKKIAGAGKRVHNIADNQAALLEEIEKVREKHRRALITGHFTLLNKKGGIKSVDVGVFRNMKPDVLILIEGDAQEIQENLRSRDSKEYSLSFIKKFQQKEAEHAQCISDALDVPLHTVRNDDVDRLKKLIYKSRTL